MRKQLKWAGVLCMRVWMDATFLFQHQVNQSYFSFEQQQQQFNMVLLLFDSSEHSISQLFICTDPENILYFGCCLWAISKRNGICVRKGAAKARLLALSAGKTDAAQIFIKIYCFQLFSQLVRNFSCLCERPYTDARIVYIWVCVFGIWLNGWMADACGLFMRSSFIQLWIYVYVVLCTFKWNNSIEWVRNDCGFQLCLECFLLVLFVHILNNFAWNSKNTEHILLYYVKTNNRC